MLCMVSYPYRSQSGHITCYLNRTYHVLPTSNATHVDNFPFGRQTTAFAGNRFWRAPAAAPHAQWLFRPYNRSSSMAMTEQRVSYTLDSSLETIDNAEQKATIIATELGFGEDEVMQISMAVREGTVNAVLHGNAYSPDK